MSHENFNSADFPSLPLGDDCNDDLVPGDSTVEDYVPEKQPEIKRTPNVVDMTTDGD